MADLKDLKSRILDDIPLSSLIGKYINITRKGSANMAVCPFHDDTNPSMSISDEKKIFKCFACGEGGNAIDFVVKYKRLDFIDALKEICAHHAIDFDQYYQKKAKDPRVEMAHRILSRATAVYQKIAQSSQGGAFQEFLKKRKLDPQVAQTYQLGLALRENILSQYLESIPGPKEKSLALEVAQDISIIKKSKQSTQGHYDTFRERIIFPIWDHYGQVIGMTSRVIREDQVPKYMNSRDSLVFNKKQLLYGLHLAKKTIRQKDRVLVVEGNMDQIALHAKGIEESVAIMGTAFGAYHLNVLKTLTQNIYFAFDSDQAGKECAKRANGICLNSKILARFIDFTPHKDADDFLNAEGRLALQKKIEEAPLYLDYAINQLIPEKVPELLDQKIKLLEEVFQLVAPLKEELSATERILTFAKALGLQSRPDVILSQYREFMKKSPLNQVHTSSQEVLPEIELEEIMNPPLQEQAPWPSDEQLQQLMETPEKVSKIEAFLVRQVVQHPELLEYIPEEKGSILDFVRSNEVKRYVSKLRELTYEVEDNEYAQVLKRVSAQMDLTEKVKQAVGHGLKTHTNSKLDQKVIKRLLADLERKLYEDKLKAEREDILAQKNICQTQQELEDILSKLSAIDKKISQLKTSKNTDFKALQGSNECP